MRRRHAGTLFGLGFSMIAITLAGLYLGVFLDRRSGKTFFAPIGLLLGLSAGIHRAWTTISALLKKDR